MVYRATSRSITSINRFFFYFKELTNGIGYTVRTCSKNSELKPSASIVDGHCYDMLDSEVYNSLTNVPFPPELRNPSVLKVNAMFCSEDLCNDESQCGAQTARTIPLFGKKDMPPFQTHLLPPPS